MLKEDVLTRTPLHLAAEAGRENSVTFLVTNHNVPVNITTKHGLTPMHLAAKVSFYHINGHQEILTIQL